MATLRDLCTMDGPFATVVMPTPSATQDALHRLEVHRKHVRRGLENAGLDELRIEALDDTLAAMPHGRGDAVVVIQPADGPSYSEFLVEQDADERIDVDGLPRFAPILENRQRSIPHVTVITDRTGADIVIVEPGQEVTNVEVEGDTLHLHRGPYGGWSQRSVQQRAENQWDHNAGDVAEQLAKVVEQIGARLVAVQGDVRAVQLLQEHLPDDVRAITHVIDVGQVGAMSEATARLCADVVARDTLDVVNRLREGRGAQTSADGPAATMAALAEGRVATLLVHDDHEDERRAWFDPDGSACGPLDGV